MKIKLIAIVALLVSLVSCDSKETETVKVSGRYAIDVPAYLSKVTNLNDGASLQYQNERKELYIIVMEEPKKVYADIVAADPESYPPGLKGYAELLLEDTRGKVKAETTPVLTQHKIGNRDGYTTDFSGEIDGLQIYWKIAYVEGRNTYYQIMAWTSTDKKEEHLEAIDAMINSFKETDKRKRH
jgi:bifunctional DNA-binding transcriptional regulator/antitoxin component of YhaV-PrlF toxin-antitoxin module